MSAGANGTTVNGAGTAAGMQRAQMRRSATGDETLGVLLMTFGSPATLDDVPAYLASVRGGRPAPEETVQEFRRRYAIIGGSPLLRLTREQAAALEERLNGTSATGSATGGASERYRVAVGMRHAPPFIADALVALAESGARQIAAIILSPQYSPFIMGGYHRAVDAGRERLRERGLDVEVTVAGAWHRHPAFLSALAARVTEALDRLPEDVRQTVPVLFTAHSMPRPVVEREPEYLEQIHETVQALVSLTGLDRPRPDGTPRWQFAYQSAGHTPEEWLKPDFKDLLPGLRDAGHSHVLVVPVQFLADHLEILYDIDVAARQEAEEAGMVFRRIESLNVSPPFIEALAGVARATLGEVPAHV